MFQYHDPDGQDLPRNTYSGSVVHTAYTESEVEQLCYDIALNYKPKTDVEVWGLSSTLTWTGDDYTIKSISSYRESDFDQTTDADATEFTVFNTEGSPRI